jgi:futalosine hydrolase
MTDKNFLLVVSTELEIKPLLDGAELYSREPRIYKTSIEDVAVDILISGVGMTFTTYNLTKTLAQNDYRFVVNAGIAGAFDHKTELGTVFNVINELFADLGLLTDKRFYNLFDMSLLKEGEFPFTKNFMHNFSLINNKVVDTLPTANGVTVNTLISDKCPPDLRMENLNPQVESMEGAAIFYVCMKEHVPFVELRSISNYVGDSDKTKWDIPLAVDNLTKTLRAMFGEIS